MLILAPTPAGAQTIVDPHIAEFEPSADHHVLLADSRPKVERYALEFYLAGAARPFQVTDLGKPLPGSDGRIRVDLSSRLSSWPLPSVIYEARVAAVGPGGRAPSEVSNPFRFSEPSAPAGSAPVTVVLSAPGRHVWDTMIQNGRHAETNFHGSPLLTRASDDPDWERRSILTIDTGSTIPRNSTIVSATLTLTVRSGLGSAGSTRKVAAYRITRPFQVRDATWTRREANAHWSTPGGNLADAYGPIDVPVTPGAQVHFDLTRLVQRAVDGALETFWTRVALVDVDSPVADPASKDSYREYFSSSAADPGVRPRLTVVYGGSASAPTGAHTVVLSEPARHVWDTMIQNGRHADSNFYGGLLLTRASTHPDWERRSIMTIDTATTVPRNARIVSATLTLTVRAGLGSAGATRRVVVHRITRPMQVTEATWKRREARALWGTPGGDLAEAYGPVEVPVTPGAQVHFDLTALVQRAVDGDLETFWTRVALVDVDSPVADPAAKASYREYYSSSASDPNVRPRLVISYD